MPNLGKTMVTLEEAQNAEMLDIVKFQWEVPIRAGENLDRDWRRKWHRNKGADDRNLE